MNNKGGVGFLNAGPKYPASESPIRLSTTEVLELLDPENFRAPNVYLHMPSWLVFMQQEALQTLLRVNLLCYDYLDHTYPNWQELQRDPEAKDHADGPTKQG